MKCNYYFHISNEESGIKQGRLILTRNHSLSSPNTAGHSITVFAVGQGENRGHNLEFNLMAGHQQKL